jgi:RimJ/RimL family protein N-acetyltransferase
VEERVRDDAAVRPSAGPGVQIGEVGLRPLGPGDLDLMRGLLGDPAMTAHLGGPQSDEEIEETFNAFLVDDAPGGIFAITAGDDPRGIGWLGYWETELHGSTVWEIGLSVLPAWQGHGLGSRAFRIGLDRAAVERRHRFVHAFVGLDNAASDRMCVRVGLERIGEEDVEYPPGHWSRCSEWRIALWPEE